MIALDSIHRLKDAVLAVIGEGYAIGSATVSSSSIEHHLTLHVYRRDVPSQQISGPSAILLLERLMPGCEPRIRTVNDFGVYSAIGDGVRIDVFGATPETVVAS